MKTRLGIVGGAFNPPHFGHLRPALEAMKLLNLDAVFFLPSGNHPFKNSDLLAPVQHRVEMTRLAIQETNDFELCELDANKSGISYTIDTLRELDERFPMGELFFLMGGDLLAEIPLWKEWKKLMTVAHICPLFRPGYDKSTTSNLESVNYFRSVLVDKPNQLNRQTLGYFGFCPLSVTPLDISSTNIRMRLGRGEDIRYLTPDPVVDYIQQHHLYGNYA